MVSRKVYGLTRLRSLASLKTAKTISDLDLTEEAGLFKNSKTKNDIRMTEETGLVQNSKTIYDPEEPALRKQKKQENSKNLLYEFA